LLEVDGVENMRRKVIALATSLALQESEETGSDYTKCISKALDEACLRLGVNRKQFIKMFI
jgi:hypothetical protein